MKRLIILIFVIIFTNCKNNVENYITYLPGYWEIDQVFLPDGTTRDYSYNETVDYIFLSDSLTGIRKKLKPNFDGKFVSFNNSESFTIKVENDSLNIYYKTPFDTWKETILFANDEMLKIINSNKNVYVYKRYIPLKIEE